MNISKYGDISKIIASYLKMDFQREVLMQITRKNKKDIRKTAFISDEYQEYITKNDAEFYAQSRETMCINIVATQSYSSLYNTVKDEFAVDVIIQSLVNKIWYRQDDIRTIEKAQKIIGKVEKERTSTTMSESSKEANYNYLLKKFITQNSNLSESINKYKVFEEKFDIKDFSYNLKTFETISMISNIIKISKKKFIIKFTIMFLIIFLSFIYIVNTYATTEKSPLLVNKFKKAFEKIQEYLILIATPAAGVAICTGLLMRKFSFGDEERVRTAKKLIRGTIIAYALIISTKLILNFILVVLK